MKSFAFDCGGKIERMRQGPAVKAAPRYQEKNRGLRLLLVATTNIWREKISVKYQEKKSELRLLLVYTINIWREKNIRKRKGS